MRKKPKRDDSWDQISPLFAELANSEEIKETERRSSRVLWMLVAITLAMAGAFELAHRTWGKAFLDVVNVVVQIGGALVVAGIGLLWFLSFIQKNKN